MKFRPSLGNSLHEGVDFGWTAAHPDPEIMASATGRVVWSGVKKGWGFGKFVVIEHDAESGKEYTLYGHLTSTTVGVGSVQAGDKIGIMGMTHDTGGAVGKHLHFEIITGTGGPSSWQTAFSGTPNSRWLYRKNPILEIDVLGGDIPVDDYGHVPPREQKERAFEDWVDGVVRQTALTPDEALTRSEVLEEIRELRLAAPRWREELVAMRIRKAGPATSL